MPPRSQTPDFLSAKSDSGLVLRDAGPSDASAVAKLHTESWQSAYRGLLPDIFLDDAVPEQHRVRWQGLLGGADESDGETPSRPDGIVRLMERNGQLNGFISVWFNYKSGYDAYVDNLHVRPGLRGGGIGGQLLRDAARRSASEGYKSLALEVLDGNLSAIRFYEKMGGVSRNRDREEMGGVMVDYQLMAWDDVTSLAAPDAIGR